MGKKMGVRGRPGLLFIIILVVFLAIFFLTWKSMITPKRKTDVKDIYSMNYQGSKPSDNTGNRPHSELNDIWNRAKLLHGDNIDSHQENGRDEDYFFKNSGKLKPINSNEKMKFVHSPLSDLLHSTHKPALKEKMTKPYYMKPDESLKIVGGRMDRLVHLDLKGAAPKVSYLKEIFPLFSRLGATGLLIEYEDMFPYTGKLEVISAQNSYTKQQISEILGLAKLNSLQVIPLIQTFGHMEFILKGLQMEDLRESAHTPQVINVASNASYDLIQEMVSQMLAAHPAVSYLHIGCDEVYELGRGRSADVVIKERLTNEALFLRHVKRVADIVAKESQKKVRPIIWDDELRKMSEKDILAAGLPSSVDIMVWRYTQNITDKLNETVWKKYGSLFKTVWAASSFKGATGPRQIYTEPQHHIINHFSWMDAVSKYSRYVSFKGIALTGWQRFDHFATLCELLPVAIPSLAVCLATIKNGGFNEDIHKTTSSLLSCSGLIEMSFPKLDEKERKAIVSQDCRFPGYMVYYAVQELWGYKQFEEESRRTGWLSDYQVKRGFSNPGQLKVLSMRMYSLESNLIRVRTPLEQNLLQIYSEDTVQEWLDENIFEMKREIKEVQEKVKGMSKNTHWARRPNLPLVVQFPTTKSPEISPNVGNVGVKRDLGAPAGRALNHPEMNRIVGTDVRKDLRSTFDKPKSNNDINVLQQKLKDRNQNLRPGMNRVVGTDARKEVGSQNFRPGMDRVVGIDVRKGVGSATGGNQMQSGLYRYDGSVNFPKQRFDNQNKNFGERVHEAPLGVNRHFEHNGNVGRPQSLQPDAFKKGNEVIKNNVLPKNNPPIVQKSFSSNRDVIEKPGLLTRNVGMDDISKKRIQGGLLGKQDLDSQQRQKLKPMGTNTDGQDDHINGLGGNKQLLKSKYFDKTTPSFIDVKVQNNIRREMELHKSSNQLLPSPKTIEEKSRLLGKNQEVESALMQKIQNEMNENEEDEDFDENPKALDDNKRL